MSESKKKQNIKGWIFITIVLLYLASVNITQALKCPHMTQTELLLNLPNTTLLIFKDC